MKKKQAWVQAAIDVENIDLGIQIAEMALEEGADWIEVGTPMLYRYGNDAIGMMRRALGEKTVLVADYKFVFPMGCIRQAEEQGANYAIFEAGYQIQLVEETLNIAKDLSIQPIFYLSVHPQDYTYYADLYADMGAKYFFTHHYYRVLDQRTHEPVLCNNAESFMACRNPIRFCITNDDFDAVQDSIRAGADWITFGRAIRTPDREACRRWIERIHGTER